MKGFLPYIPALLFPYLTAALALCLFFGGEVIDAVFAGNIWRGVALLILYYFVSLIFTAALSVRKITSGCEARSCARYSMILKLAQIPAYITLFIIGLGCLITIFTFGITFTLIVFDCMAVFLDGVAAVPSVIRGARERKLTVAESVIFGILGFFFCADVVSAVIVYMKTRVTIDKRTASSELAVFFHNFSIARDRALSG